MKSTTKTDRLGGISLFLFKGMVFAGRGFRFPFASSDAAMFLFILAVERKPLTAFLFVGTKSDLGAALRVIRGRHLRFWVVLSATLKSLKRFNSMRSLSSIYFLPAISEIGNSTSSLAKGSL